MARWLATRAENCQFLRQLSGRSKPLGPFARPPVYMLPVHLMPVRQSPAFVKIHSSVPRPSKTCSPPLLQPPVLPLHTSLGPSPPPDAHMRGATPPSAIYLSASCPFLSVRSSSAVRLRARLRRGAAPTEGRLLRTTRTDNPHCNSLAIHSVDEPCQYGDGGGDRGKMARSIKRSEGCRVLGVCSQG